MATSSIGSVFQQLHWSLCLHEDAPQDALLLKQFIEHRDEAAFAALVRRHGSMVMGVCRRQLHDQHDAEDAFQATFLILVRKAASIVKRELLANWLYGVVYKTALKARAINMRRRAKEKQVAEMPDLVVGESSVAGEHLLALLDQELSRLPKRYRVPILLCDLEGKTRRQAAALLDCPEGSLSSRLARGRALLARRLTRLGVAVSAGAIGAALVQQAASASVSSGLLASTVKSSVLLAAGEVAVSALPSKAATLMEGVMKVMLLSKLRVGAFWLLVGLFAFGTGIALFPRVMAQTQAEQAQEDTKGSPSTSGKERGAQPEDQLKKDAAALQGKWSVELMIVEGDVVPADITKAVIVEFKGDTVTLKPDIGADATRPGKIKFNLYDNPNLTQFKLRGPNPRLIELTLLDPYEKPKPSTCNYQLKGDTLVILDGEAGKEKTPVDITPKKLRQHLIVMKRLPKKGTDQKEGKELSRPVPIKQSWDGTISDRRLLKELPNQGIVVENQSWAKLWNAWRSHEELPKIKFDKEMALVLTSTGPSNLSASELFVDAQGNLKVPAPTSMLPLDDARLGYKIIIIDRAGLNSVNDIRLEKAPGIENNAKDQEAVERSSKEEGTKKRGPRFFVLAMLLNPAAYDPPPRISEEVALALLGEPDFEDELGVQQADGKIVDRLVNYIYIVDNRQGQTIPKDWKMAATEKIEVSLTIRDGSVVGTGWNTYSGKEGYPAYRKGKNP
jgi:RNA polymerase sigma factor (sigma-70 family)